MNNQANDVPNTMLGDSVSAYNHNRSIVLAAGQLRLDETSEIIKMGDRILGYVRGEQTSPELIAESIEGICQFILYLRSFDSFVLHCLRDGNLLIQRSVFTFLGLRYSITGQQESRVEIQKIMRSSTTDDATKKLAEATLCLFDGNVNEYFRIRRLMMNSSQEPV